MSHICAQLHVLGGACSSVVAMCGWGAVCRAAGDGTGLAVDTSALAVSACRVAEGITDRAMGITSFSSDSAPLARMVKQASEPGSYAKYMHIKRQS